MELQCPQCAKVMQVSAEEVALHGGVVVCPQCLATFDASDSVPAGTEARRVPVRVIDEHLTYCFCPHCGQRIPQGVNFCPYCGKSLKQLPEQPQPQPQPDDDNHDAETRQPAERTHREHRSSSKRHDDKHHHSHRKQHSSSAGKTWNPMLPTYRYASTQRPGKQKAGTSFTICALVVIAAQLALLVFIIYKVSLFN